MNRQQRRERAAQVAKRKRKQAKRADDLGERAADLLRRHAARKALELVSRPEAREALAGALPAARRDMAGRLIDVDDAQVAAGVAGRLVFDPVERRWFSIGAALRHPIAWARWRWRPAP